MEYLEVRRFDIKPFGEPEQLEVKYSIASRISAQEFPALEKTREPFSRT